eukprot:g24352.t1
MQTFATTILSRSNSANGCRGGSAVGKELQVGGGGLLWFSILPRDASTAMAGVVKASAQSQTETQELTRFVGSHPFYTSLPRKKQKAAKKAVTKKKSLSIDDPEKEDDQLGVETVFDNQNDSGPDLIRDAAMCLQVTLASRFLTRPTPFCSAEDNRITSAFNSLSALWWAIANHPRLRGGSNWIPNKYQTPENKVDSDSDQAGDDTNIDDTANQDPEEKYSKARPAKKFEKKKRSNKSQTHTPFTKDQHVLTYKRHLARACETLESYANVVSVRALGMQDDEVQVDASTNEIG